MYYIVGDIGNTSTRICLLNKKFTITKSIICDTKKFFNKSYTRKIFKKLLKNKVRKEILFSSVVPSVLKKIKKNIKEFKLKIIEIKKLNLKKLIKINIKNISQLGSDRIVNSIEGKKFKNCLIIDFGTATTFDIVKNSIYEGGVIAPGVKLSMKNLSQSTALLPMFNLKNKQKSYGKNTKDALNAGFIWGYEGLINNIINKITLNWKMNYKKNTLVDQNITIKGVSRVYKELL